MDAITERILVCDGAIGTELRKRISSPLPCVDACNIMEEHAHKVIEIHQAYLNAGSDVIQTNTYQANREALTPHGYEDELEEINRMGVKLARSAASTKSFVAGSIGQIPFHTQDVTESTVIPSSKTIRRLFQEQMDTLVDEGVDLLILETFVLQKQTEIATKQALSYGIPVIVEISGISGGTLGTGVDVRVFAQEIEQLGAHAVGINCRGPHDLVQAMELLAPVIKCPLVVQPNAGNPRVEQGEIAVSYTVDADAFSDYVQKLINLGANMIGGCCGTTPEYTAKIKAVVAGRQPVRRQPRIFILPKSTPSRQSFRDNPVEEVFKTRERIVSVETRANTFPQLPRIVEGSTSNGCNWC